MSKIFPCTAATSLPVVRKEAPRLVTGLVADHIVCFGALSPLLALEQKKTK